MRRYYVTLATMCPLTTTYHEHFVDAEREARTTLARVGKIGDVATISSAIDDIVLKRFRVNDAGFVVAIKEERIVV